MSLNSTPRGERLHIGIFGKRNSGKSSLLNAICGRSVALVSDVAGTTTDPVYKTMELFPLGPCVFIDTAGFDDAGKLGALRVEKTLAALDTTDIAILAIAGEPKDIDFEYVKLFCDKKIPFVIVSTMSDIQKTPVTIMGQSAIEASAKTGEGIARIRAALAEKMPEDFGAPKIVAHLVQGGDSVLLVMPQDIQAPRGRLILPQVQTIRELLDLGCIVTAVTADRIDDALASMKAPPKLIITDSQVFPIVYKKKPRESLLTSFSVLFARYKGDIDEFVRGAKALASLTEKSSVLIAEACTHAPQEEDIGRVKIPHLLRKAVGENLKIDFVSGSDFDDALSGHDLIIHCGACMYNRRHVLSRIERAKALGIPITNYGITLAALGGILDKISY